MAGDLHAVQRNSCAGIDTLELQPDLLGSNIKGGCRELRFIGAGAAPIIIAAVLTIDVVPGVRQIDGDGLAVRAGELPSSSSAWSCFALRPPVLFFIVFVL